MELIHVPGGFKAIRRDDGGRIVLEVFLDEDDARTLISSGIRYVGGQPDDDGRIIISADSAGWLRGDTTV